MIFYNDVVVGSLYAICAGKCWIWCGECWREFRVAPWTPAIRWLVIKIPFSGNGHSSRIKKYFANLSRTSCFFVESMLSNNSSYEDSFITCQITQNYQNTQLASQNPLLRTSCCWLGNFWQGFWATSLQNALWLLPTLSQNFRETVQSLTFLEAWLLHLEIVSWDFRKQSSAVPAAGARRCFKTMVFGSPSEAWLLPMVRYHSPAGPRAAGGGSP